MSRTAANVPRGFWAKLSGVKPDERLQFHGGMAGALAPFALFLAGVAWLGLSGAPDERGFWAVLVAALTLGLLLARNRSAYAENMIGGMSRRIVMLMVTAWMLAGVLAALLSAGGFVEALVWLAGQSGVSRGLFCAAAFLVAQSGDPSAAVGEKGMDVAKLLRGRYDPPRVQRSLLRGPRCVFPPNAHLAEPVHLGYFCMHTKVVSATWGRSANGGRHAAPSTGLLAIGCERGRILCMAAT